MKRVAAVIVFTANFTKDEAGRLLETLVASGYLEGHPEVEEFDPDLGTPVFYIP